MQEDRKTIYLRLLVELAVAAVAIAFAALLGRPILGIMLPFILAFIMAWALNPVIQILQRRLRLTRKLFSYILVLMIYAVLGVLASLALFWDGIFKTNKEQGGFSFSLIAAVVIAMLVPNIIEKQGLRKIPKVRTTMAIALMVCIVVYFLYMGLTTGFNFRA